MIETVNGVISLEYEDLLKESTANNVYIIENADFKSKADGLINGNVIGINKNVRTSRKRTCILAEELGHYHTTAGDIVCQSTVSDRKQELRARIWAYNKLIGLNGIVIEINKNVRTSRKRTCILAEELGHYHTTAGDIVCQSTVSDRKQELRARIWAYNKLIGLNGIVNACKHGCHSLHDTADYLNVTEEFLLEALQYYKGKYGIYATIDNYVIYFEPSLGVFELV